MDSRRFDSFTRSLGKDLPRRGLLRALAAASAALGVTRLAGPPAVARAQVANPTGSVGLPCVPCNCVGEVCDCCLIGITGGGLLRTTAGDITLVLFATQLAEDAPQEAAGFVRWMDPNSEGGLSLESVGPIAYDWPEGEEHFRNVRGTMMVNGEAQHPFVLEVFDAGPGISGEDTARLKVGDAANGGFGYEMAGTLVGGDLQLLESAAPITPAT